MNAFSSFNMNIFTASPTEVAERIRQRMVDLDLTQADLVRLTGASKGTVSKWLSGVNIPSGKFVSAVVRALKTNSAWLYDGTGNPDDQEVHKPRPRVRFVPVKGTGRMGNDGYFNFCDSYAHEAGDGYVPSYSASSSAYALRGSGGSMYPAIRDGWYVVCEPETNPVPTEFVLVCLRDNRCIIKEYISQSNDLLHLLSVSGSERLTLDISEVLAIVPIIEIIPPSRRVLEIPVFDV